MSEPTFGTLRDGKYYVEDENGKWLSVARMVLRTFRPHEPGNMDEKGIVGWYDGNQRNNCLENLYWAPGPGWGTLSPCLVEIARKSKC